MFFFLKKSSNHLPNSSSGDGKESYNFCCIFSVSEGGGANEVKFASSFLFSPLFKFDLPINGSSNPDF